MAEMVYEEKEMRELVPLIMCEKYNALFEIDRCVKCKFFMGRKLDPIKVVRIVCDYKVEL